MSITCSWKCCRILSQGLSYTRTISSCLLITGGIGVLDEFRFWTEQYLLQTFLAFNSEFEVLMANSYLNDYYQEELKAAFPDLLSCGGGSFWMRRKLPLRLTGSGDKSKGTKLKKRRDVT
jgi:hypothetical protein